VQTPSNLVYFEEHQAAQKGRLEVLNNWLSEPNPEPCSINIDDSPLAGRKIFVYTGNIGLAQGMDILLDLVDVLQEDESIGFMFVGRGSAVAKMKEKSARLGLSNILFYDEIRPNEIPSLLEACHAGLIALDPRHRNDNIPGKFLAYMQSGLPVLGNINPGNDLLTLVERSRVGQVVSSNSLQDLQQAAEVLLEEIENDPDIKSRCRELAKSQFSATRAAEQIVGALSNESKR
jgi:glycosyltransferase involved in cell wall biosynthesis